MNNFRASRTDFLVNVCTIRREHIRELENKAIDMVKDHIQRLSIRGTKEYTLDEHKFATHLANMEQQETNKQQAQQQQQQRSRVDVTSRMEQVIMTQSRQCRMRNGCRSCQMEQQQQQLQNQSEIIRQHEQNHSQESEPVYAVVDLQHKYAQRRLRNSAGSRFSCGLQQKRCNSYDSIVQYSGSGSMLYRHEKRNSLAEDDIDGIYEDGDKLFCPVAQSSLLQNETMQQRRTIANDDVAGAVVDDDDEENIYEPINIPAAYAQPNRAFWKYLTRLRVKPLLQLTRFGKRSNSTHPDYDVIKLPTVSNNNNNNSMNVTAVATTAGLATTSHFANIKHKFGTQRKSIRARMRKLCVRTTYEPKALFNGKNNNNGPSCSTQMMTTATTTASSKLTPSTNASACAQITNHVKNKKLRYHWRTVKLRPKNSVGIATTPTVTTSNETMRATRRFFSGSLPHMRKFPTRVSLFAAQTQQQPQPQICNLPKSKEPCTLKNS